MPIPQAGSSLSRRMMVRLMGLGAGTAALGGAAACANDAPQDAAAEASTPAPTPGSGEPTQTLEDAIIDFHDGAYRENQELYDQLSDAQSPHTLLITCADSRIDGETVLSSNPGEIFQMRNIANIVPHADDDFDVSSPMAVMEYAVKSLEVQAIIVMAHSDCGGMAALQNLPEYKDSLPYTHDWLQLSESVLEQTRAEHDPQAPDFSVRLEQANAAAQLDRLRSHDFITERIESGDMRVEALHYNIGEGVVTIYDQDSGEFRKP